MPTESGQKHNFRDLLFCIASLELGTTFKQYATVLTLQLVILLKVSKCHCVEET